MHRRPKLAVDVAISQLLLFGTSLNININKLFLIIEKHTKLLQLAGNAETVALSVLCVIDGWSRFGFQHIHYNNGPDHSTAFSVSGGRMMIARQVEKVCQLKGDGLANAWWIWACYIWPNKQRWRDPGKTSPWEETILRNFDGEMQSCKVKSKQSLTHSGSQSENNCLKFLACKQVWSNRYIVHSFVLKKLSYWLSALSYKINQVLRLWEPFRDFKTTN